MLPLDSDVFDHFLDIPGRNGECAVSCLPSEMFELNTLGLDPFRGRPFDFFGRIGHGHGTAELEQYVNVIFNGIDQARWTCLLQKDASHVAMQPITYSIVYERLSAFSAKDEMDVQFCE